MFSVLVDHCLSFCPFSLGHYIVCSLGHYIVCSLAEGAIKKNCQHWAHKKQDEEKLNHNTTQYVLDTTIRKQTEIT
jgi:hypothetical protein